MRIPMPVEVGDMIDLQIDVMGLILDVVSRRENDILAICLWPPGDDEEVTASYVCYDDEDYEKNLTLRIYRHGDLVWEMTPAEFESVRDLSGF